MQLTWLRENLIGAMALTIVAIAGTSASAGGVEGAAGEPMNHSMATAAYAVPNVRLVRQDGTPVMLRDELNDGRPVVLAFIYTSCTTVCPVISHTLSQLQSKLGENAGRVHLMSITLDPEQDNPARLREYAKTFNAGPGWQHYTGTLAASQTVQRAFDIYRGNKMDHVPATLIRSAPGAPWARIEGFPTADELFAELSDHTDPRAVR
jgi:protein SCO1/2